MQLRRDLTVSVQSYGGTDVDDDGTRGSEFYAAMAMQGIISREKLPADEVVRQAVAYADALILAIEANAQCLAWS